jgi:hypothetical protein
MKNRSETLPGVVKPVVTLLTVTVGYGTFKPPSTASLTMPRTSTRALLVRAPGTVAVGLLLLLPNGMARPASPVFTGASKVRIGAV